MAKLKIAGTWSGVLEVELENWSVVMLRAEVARRSSCGPESIKLICAGKLLKDGDGSEKLSQAGVKNNAKILASRVCVEEGQALKVELLAEDERARRLARVKAAATALSKRHADGSLPDDDYNLELENQSGNQIQLGSETDKRAIMMGLMLHAKAKQLIRTQKFQDALEVLVMGEEAFSLCNPDVIEGVDNIAILQIDMVWCYFMLRDISWLSEAGLRLDKARKGIERVHGKDSWRIRIVQAGRYPELALHLRLELLEGVVAYHSGQLDKSAKALNSAQEKFVKLQVRDEDLSFVMSMGYKERDVKRALRMSNQDVGSAIDFLIEEKARRAQEREKNIQRRNEIMEQKQYGVTALKKAVDLQRLSELVSIGFEKELAAEALRRNENNSEKALDDLTNPETNSDIQVAIESRKRKRDQQAANASIEQLVSMGFERSRVVAAVEAGCTVEDAMHRLLTHAEPNPTFSANTSGLGDESNNDTILPNNTGLAPSSEGPGINVGDASTSSEVEERDAEMEDELAEELAHADALSDYDIEVTKEGEAITEYLALLASAGISGNA